jgi:4-hydroxybenzoate polyprenyltransferase
VKSDRSAAANYLSLVKFSHTIFAMPFAVMGFFLAVVFTKATVDWKLFVFVILCMVFARSAAMAFNRYIDRKFDEKNKRTAIREIPAGIITPKNALVFIILNCILFITTTFFINHICFYLSPVALLVILGYSYTKRFTALCHVVLGVGLSLAPIGSWLAVTGSFAVLPLLYSFSVLFWVSGFDIIYALQDDEFDRSQRLHSIPVALGRRGGLLLSTIFHVISGGLVIYAGIYAEFDLWYWIGTLVFCGLLVYQHLLVKPNDLSKVNLAFMTTNGVASLIFCAFVLLELFL